MIGIISSLALLTMFALITNEERLRARNCHALYLARFNNGLVSKDDRLKMIAKELSLHTNVRHIATHGCVICRAKEQLFTLTEALVQVERVRMSAF